jgi:hypothetical protein
VTDVQTKIIVEIMNERLNRLRDIYAAHEHRFDLAFFVGGFLFDVVMVQRIDEIATIAQQVVYLSIVLIGLMQMFFEENAPDVTDMFVVKRYYFTYRTAILHFFLGTLLNMYTIFFFKSSSLVTSFVFLVLLGALLVANESHRFKGLGLAFKFTLLSVCLLSFASCIVPIAAGYVGPLVFFLGMVTGCLPLVAIGWWLQARRPQFFERAKTEILLPMAAVLIGYSTLYLLKVTPPVPISIPFIGVYHGVEKTAAGYRLAHERPWWKFWQNGDQDFVAQPPDRIYVAFRIFSPTHFSDQVTVQWYWKDNRLGWVLQDAIPIRIVGGRHEGFRGYGVKSNYQPGAWKVQIESADGREIGRVYFDLSIAPEAPRAFEYETM